MNAWDVRWITIAGNALHAVVTPAGGTNADRTVRITPRHGDSLTTGDAKAALDYIIERSPREAHRTA